MCWGIAYPPLNDLIPAPEPDPPDPEPNPPIPIDIPMDADDGPENPPAAWKASILSSSLSEPDREPDADSLSEEVYIPGDVFCRGGVCCIAVVDSDAAGSVPAATVGNVRAFDADDCSGRAGPG